jgi:hypothetical protein
MPPLPDPAAAIAALPSGGTWDGGGLSYTTQGIVITQPCTVQNATINNPTALGASNINPCIQIKGTTNVTLSNLALSGEYPNNGNFYGGLADGYGVQIQSSSHITINAVTTLNTFSDGLVATFDSGGPQSSAITVNGMTITNPGREGVTVAGVDNSVGVNVFNDITVSNPVHNALSNETDVNLLGSGYCTFNNFTFDGGGFNLISYLNGPMVFNDINGNGRLILVDGFGNQTVTINGGSWEFPSTSGSQACIQMTGGKITFDGVAITRAPGVPNLPMWNVTQGTPQTRVAVTNGDIPDVTVFTGSQEMGIHSPANVPVSAVGAGSNGGDITTIATWADPSAGVLALTSDATFTANIPNGGIATVGGAQVQFLATATDELTACTLVSGSGTVTTNEPVGALLNTQLDDRNFNVNITEGSTIVEIAPVIELSTGFTSDTLTLVSGALLFPGMTVTGPGITGSATVTKQDGKTVTLSGTFTGLQDNVNYTFNGPPYFGPQDVGRTASGTELNPNTITGFYGPLAALANPARRTIEGVTLTTSGSALFTYTGAVGTNPRTSFLTGVTWLNSAESQSGSIGTAGYLNVQGITIGGLLTLIDSPYVLPTGTTDALSRVVIETTGETGDAPGAGGYGTRAYGGALAFFTLPPAPVVPVPYYGPDVIFECPQVRDRPPYLPDSSPRQVMLMRHFENRLRGVNVFQRSDGTFCVDTPANYEAAQTHPAVFFSDDAGSPDLTAEQQGLSDSNLNWPWNPFPGSTNSNVPGSYAYNVNWDQTTEDFVLNPHILAWFEGGTIIPITQQEALVLTGAGFGDCIGEVAPEPYTNNAPNYRPYND